MKMGLDTNSRRVDSGMEVVVPVYTNQDAMGATIAAIRVDEAVKYEEKLQNFKGTVTKLRAAA